jgi:hypothetical protein
MFSKDFFIRDFEGDAYREGFLVSAAVTIFVIRIFLALTHYPQLGTRNLHIAHSLYGGFFMLAAIIVLLSFLSKKAGYVASVLGGIGFGFFIDEFGKYITHDNDYFFQPTVALIYISFVLLYLITKFIPNARKPDEKEYLVNAIEMIKESAINDFDIEEEKRAKEYLKRCDPANPIVQSLTSLLTKIDATETPQPNLYTKLRMQLRQWYYTVARSGIILKVVMAYLVLQTLSTFFQTAVILMTRPTLGLDEWGKLYSSSLAGVFVLMGFFSLRFSKVEAYRFFRIAMLITIFLTEFFAFMHSEWLELINLCANIFILLVINYAQTLEKQKHKTKLLATA